MEMKVREARLKYLKEKAVAQIYILGMSGGRRLVVRLTTLWGPLRSLPP